MTTFRPAPLTLLLAVLLLLLPRPGAAQTIQWTGNGDGTTYASAANWDGVNIPDTVGENAAFNVAATFNVLFGSSSSTTIGDLFANAGDITFHNLGGTDATLNISDDLLLGGGNLTLARLGGTADVNLDVADVLEVDNDSEFDITEGAEVTAARIRIGATGGTNRTATVTVDGTGSSLHATGTTLANQIGDGTRTGTVNVQNGATATFDFDIEMGGGIAGTEGYLNVLSGGDVMAAGNLAVGSGASTNQTAITVSGLGSTFAQSGSGNIDVGNTDAGNVAQIDVNTSGTFSTGTGTTTIRESGMLTITDGTFNANGALTMLAGSTLTLNGGALNAAAGLDNSAGGTLNFLDGLLTVSGGAFVPNAGALYTIQGPSAAELPHLQIGAGATLNFGNGLFVGLTRRGELTVTGGGSISSSTGVIGDTDGSTGMATVVGAGSTWTTSGSLFVGDGGDGTLNIQNGGAVSSDEGLIGILSTSTGTATVDGAGSTWTISLGLFVGGGGDGTLNIQNGGAVSNNIGVIGNNSISTGTVTVSGTDGLATRSTWDNSADLTVGNQGTGALSVDGGGLVTSMFDAFIGLNAGSSGDVDVIGTDAAGTPSTWLTTTLTVGIDGTGDLAITGGGQVTAFGLSDIGQSTGTGIVTVSGTDGLGLRSNLTTGPLTIGNAGVGTLTIADGGEGLVLGGSTSLGALSSGVGTATVDGVGSTWTNSFNLTVGNAGNGTLTIQNGGAVSSGTFGTIGGLTGSTGGVTVDGTGSTWLLGGNVFVGFSGDGTLNVQNGGAVTNVEGSIGSATGSTGMAIVDNASWTSTGNMHVGDAGNGTLLIQNGGVVANDAALIALSSSATGTVTVSGSSSTWTSSSVDVGVNGAGSLTVENQGLVDSGGLLSVRGTGTVTISGGTIALDTLSIESGGTFNFNFGTLNFKNNLSIAPSDGLETALGGSHSVSFGQVLQVDGTTTLNNIFTLGGGTLSTADLVNPQLLQFNTGTLAFTGAGGMTVGAAGPLAAAVTVKNDQTISVTNTATVDAGATLEVQTGGTFVAGTLANSGQVSGTGVIQTTLANSSTGEIFVGTGEHLRVQGSGHTNAGQFTLGSGTLNFDGDVTNQSSGLVIGTGTYRADGGTTNDGTMALSATSNLIGDVTNNAAGQITVTGGTTTFFDDVTNDGTLQISEGATAVFFGSFGGSQGTTGTGKARMEGDLKPGNSPAEINFGGDLTFGSSALLEIELAGNSIGPPTEYDRLLVAGTATLDGTLDVLLIDGFENAISSGDQFTILDATTLTGTFSNIAPGGRLAIEEFNADVRVDYGATSPFDPNQLVLSDFTFIPQVAIWSIGNGDWETASNWDINQVPDNDPPDVYHAIVSSFVPSRGPTLSTPVEIQELTLQQGTVFSDSTLSVTHNFEWTDGDISGSGIVVVDGVGTISNPGNGKSISGALSNLGVLDWQGGNIAFGGAFDNQGTLSVTGADTRDFAPVVTNQTNASILHTSPATVSFRVMENDGLVEISGGGTLQVGQSGGDGSDGDFLVTNGRLELGFNAVAQHTVRGAISGQDVVLQKATILGSYDVESTEIIGIGLIGVVFDTPQPALTDTLRVNAIGSSLTVESQLDAQNLEWLRGTIDGAGMIVLHGTGTITGSDTPVLIGTLVNAGTLDWQEGHVGTGGGLLQNQNTLEITGSGIRDFGPFVTNEANASILHTSTATTFFRGMVNDGLVEINGGGTLNASSSGGATTNNGTMYVQQGQLNFVGALTNVSANTLTGGEWIVEDNATLSFPGSTSITTNAADVILRGPGSIFDAIGALVDNQGSFEINVGRDFATIGNLTNSGQLVNGFASILTVGGSFTQETTGTLAIEIGGTMAGTDHGQLAVTGAAMLDGTLAVTLVDVGGGLFAPVLNDTFTILTATAGVSGMFATTAAELPALAAGLSWQIDYGANDVVLSVLELFTADFDNDGDVDGRDFLLIQRNNPSLIPQWETEFGTGVGAVSSPTTAVPEPASIVLFAVFATIACLRKAAGA